jgi:hypothetical protein
MTDASVGVTMERVKEFTKAYLDSIGAETQEVSEDRLRVSLPDGVLSAEFSEVVFGEETETSEGAVAVGPETDFFKRLVDRAAEEQSFGKVDISEVADATLPGWLTESDVDVRSHNFVPYYDRTAVVVLFSVSVETVSEYETELLRGLAVDMRSNEVLNGMESTLLEVVGENPSVADVEVDEAEVMEAVEAARDEAVEIVTPEIEEIREKASKAAAVEMEEYRSLQKERLSEKCEEAEEVREKMRDATETAEDTEERGERLAALRKRESLGERLEELEAEIEEIEEERKNDYPEKRREVYDRHSVDVRIEPASVTVVSYEKGDLVVETASDEMVFDYATGVGVTEEVICENCGRELSEENPLSSDGRLRCDGC